jgi:hypothetical protein
MIYEVYDSFLDSVIAKTDNKPEAIEIKNNLIEEGRTGLTILETEED